MTAESSILRCTDLAVGYGDKPVMSHLSFTLEPGKILAIVGPSGCGKSTLMRVLGGLDQPIEGECFLLQQNLVTATTREKEETLKQTGFLFQGSALFSSLTLRENVEMPMREFLNVSPAQIRQLAEYKLALVGLADAMDKLPSEISGGMAKRAGIARAMALDPEIIFLDEPSAGLDPITSARLDELILKLRESFGTTIVLVSHEVPSILRTADFCVYLDPDTGTMSAYGPPKTLLQDQSNRKVHDFFFRPTIS
jgi:phospholipid/cholesterol/gamma-HCH transport system ATP-binding protein